MTHPSFYQRFKYTTRREGRGRLTYLSIEETIKLWKSDKAHDVVRDGLPTSAERRRRGGEIPANALADVNIRGDVMRVDPSAAGWSVTFVCFGAVGVVQDGCDARWARRRRGTCRVRLRRNGRRRVVWMMMMWRPSIASLSLEINLSRFGFGNMNPLVLYRIQRWSLASC